MGAISTIHLPQAILTVYHHPGRSREIFYYLKFFHYQFSFCFSIITFKAEKQSKKNAGFCTPARYPFWLCDPGQVSFASQFLHCNITGLQTIT